MRRNKLDTENTENHSVPQRLCACLCLLCVLCGIALLDLGCNNEGPSPPKTPREELETFQIEEGLQVQLIASEPMVEDPVFITFDEQNRLWVVEMRGFMLDEYGNGEDQRIGRISVLQDTTGDGIMDVSTIFIDKLIMPRALALVNDGALFVEDQKLWFSPDTNGDLVADSRQLIDSTYGGPPLPEHSPNGLFRGIDNWYYNAKSAVRYKPDGDKWIRDSTEFRGQWGIGHDDQGRLFYNYNWSQLHADLVPPNYLSRNPHHKPTTGIDHGLTLDRRIYPIRSNPAVNRGYIPGTLDEKGRLMEFTAACSPFVYRARTLPDEYYGNAFVAEPSGNLVKRNVVLQQSATLSAYDPHPGTEFMASTDERFRPVSITSGPDGALYIIDMYRGLIQHTKYVTPYLREQSIKRDLVRPIHYGRIWRVVPMKRTQPDSVGHPASTLKEYIGLLGSDNGWVRDFAQKKLVSSANGDEVARGLETAAVSGNDLQRLHALWTLEGIGQLTPKILRPLLADPNDAVANAALRLIEPFANADKSLQVSLGKQVLSMNLLGNYVRQLQYALSSTALASEHRAELLQSIITMRADSALMRDAVMSSLTNEEFNLLQRLVSSSRWSEQTQGREIFVESLTGAAIRKNDPKEIERILQLADNNAWHSRSIISGITSFAHIDQPITLSKEPHLVKSANVDSLQKERISQLFVWPGHAFNANAATTVKLNDRDRQRFTEGRQLYLTSCAACHGTNGTGMNHLAPTLIRSEWVLGNERRLALLVLHGLEGPIEVVGKRYDIPNILPVMPSHSTLDDGAITSILTYIRNEWGNNAGAVNPRTVGQTRHLTQGRVQPWTVEELNKHIADSTIRE
jgi:mono/diheme cytochrome c family protein/glucose/arabinose dehydrogenase